MSVEGSEIRADYVRPWQMAAEILQVGTNLVLIYTGAPDARLPGMQLAVTYMEPIGDSDYDSVCCQLRRLQVHQTLQQLGLALQPPMKRQPVYQCRCRHADCGAESGLLKEGEVTSWIERHTREVHEQEVGDDYKPWHFADPPLN